MPRGFEKKRDWSAHDQVADLEDEGEGVAEGVVEEDDLAGGVEELEVVGDGEEEVEHDGECEDGEVGESELARGVVLQVVEAQGEQQANALDRVARDACDFEKGIEVDLAHSCCEVGGGVGGDVGEAVAGEDEGWLGDRSAA